MMLQNNQSLAELADVADEDRTALPNSTVALVYRDGFVLQERATVRALLATSKRSHGFGYDPLFWPEDTPWQSLSLTRRTPSLSPFHALQDLWQILG